LRIFDLFESLWALNPNITSRDEYWWPNSMSFEVVVGAILTQQTKWENVQKCLDNLAKLSLLHHEKIAICDIFVLSNIIRPSGFYKTKAKRLKALCNAMVDDFHDFEDFVDTVSREWLLSRNGIGKETADSILCYACERNVMVIDNYTFKLLKTELNIEDMEYDEIQELIQNDVVSNYSKFANLIGENEPSLCKIYALFHGLIVEFCKNNYKGQVAKVRLLES
jgi:endonuclease-3 related protein